MRVVLAACWLVLGGAAAPLGAAECPGNPDALGTSRILSVSPAEYQEIGSMQYPKTLPLADHEIVLTFDDGPLPPSTGRVLDILESQCIKATFFIIGRMANAHPQLVRRARDEGHTIGTHTQNHPLHALPFEKMQREIDDGIASVARALGDAREVAPFFRFPGLFHPPAVEDYLASRGIMVWSADFPADDWKRISPDQVVKRALDRLERHGRGILLLHDMQRRTVAALPKLLQALKERGYRVVGVAPAGAQVPQVIAAPRSWLVGVP